MEWINGYGLLFMAIIMIPNIVFAVKNKDGFQNLWENKAVETLEQVGRFGSFAFMVITIPGCGFGFASHEAFVLYLIANAVLTAAYCLIWILCFHKNSVFRALALSILPSAVFILSGVLSHYWPLLLCAVLFAPCHILLSYKNAALEAKK